MIQVKLPVIIIGWGGHAKVVADVLRLQGYSILGFTELDEDLKSRGSDVLCLGDDAVIARYHPEKVLLANGLGSTQTTTARKKIYVEFSEKGYHFVCCIHPSAIIATDVEIGDGAQIMAGSVVQPGCKIGRNVILNTRASIDHDCEIGDHVHIAPGATLSGKVHVAPGAHIGTGATVIQGVVIGQHSIIGAGSVVLKDIAANNLVVGIPAREVLT